MGWSAKIRSFLRMKIPSSTELNCRESQDGISAPHLQEVSGQARFAGVDEHEAAVEVLDPLLADLEVHGLNVQRQLGLRQAQVDAPLQPPIWSCQPPPVVSSCSRYSTCRTRHLASISSTVTVWLLSPQLLPPHPLPPLPSPWSGPAILHLSSAPAPGTVPVEHNTWLASQAQFGLWVPSYPPPLPPTPDLVLPAPICHLQLFQVQHL